MALERAGENTDLVSCSLQPFRVLTDPVGVFKLLFDQEKLAKELNVESCIKIKWYHCGSK